MARHSRRKNRHFNRSARSEVMRPHIPVDTEMGNEVVDIQATEDKPVQVETTANPSPKSDRLRIVIRLSSSQAPVNEM